MTATEEIDPPGTMAARPIEETRLRRFRPDIEGLRAVAVILVVLSHSGLALTGGYVGVDVFFVISGFLITRQLNDELQRYRRVSFSRFYARRARRIIPAAAVVIVATLLACWHWVSPLRMASITRDAAFAAFSGVNWRFAIQGTDYFQSTAPPSPFQHFWSLSVEEQFYLLWPMLLVTTVLTAGRLIGRQRAIVGLLTVIVAVSLYLSITVTSRSLPWAYFGTHTRAWELGLGALIAVTARHVARVPLVLAAVGSWLGIAMIVFAGWHFTDSTLYPGSAALVPVVGAALVIAAGCANPRGGVETVLALRPAQFVGQVSYSWYLWHWPILIIAPIALGYSLSTAQSLIGVAASLVLAIGSYYLVETPFRRRTGLIEYPQRAIGLGGLIVGCTILIANSINGAVEIPGVALAASGPSVASASAITAPLISGISPAVTEAAKITNLPPVTPSLVAAPNDQADPRNCFIDYSGTTPNTSRSCVFGDPNGSKTMVLFGDSHAAQWNGPLAEWATVNHWQVWLLVKASCPPGDYENLVVPNLHRVYTECNAWRAKALQFIQTLKPQLVVMGSLAKVEAVGSDGAGLVRTMSTIKASGAKMLFMADTPRMESLIPDCLAQHAQNIQSCAVSPVEGLLGSIPRNAEIEAARRIGATIFDPSPWLCTNTTCPPVISNMVVYRDDGHLTNTYAKTLTVPVGQAVLAATK